MAVFQVLGQGSMLFDIRNYILKGVLLLARIINPIVIFFFDTSLIFAWILSFFSVVLGYRMKLGKVMTFYIYEYHVVFYRGVEQHFYSLLLPESCVQTG